MFAETMHILQNALYGNPNIGIYGLCTDSFLLLPRDTPKTFLEQAKTLFQVPIHKLSITGTELLGAFLTSNGTELLIPDILFDKETDALKKTKIPYRTFTTTHTCLGNNIVWNNHGAIISPDYSKEEVTQLKKILNVPIIQMKIAETHTVGSCITLNNTKGIIHREATDEEITKAEKILNITLERATVNLGNPHIKAGILNNTNGIMIGNTTGGPEMVHIDQSLGYTEE